MGENIQNTRINGARLRDLLETAGVRCTRQRLLLANIMLEKPQHLSAEQIIDRLRNSGSTVSKATVYNTLGLFAEKGILREVNVDPSRVFYDTNNSSHHHFYNVDTGELSDIDSGQVPVDQLPNAPDGTVVDGVEVIIRVRNSGNSGTA